MTIGELVTFFPRPKLVTLVLLVFFAVPAYAALDLAAAAGPTLTSQNISTPAGSSAVANTAAAAGVFWNLVFPDTNLGFSSGLFYVQTGGHIQSTVFGQGATYDVKTPWFQVPIELQYWPWEFLGLGLGVYGGLPLGPTVGNGTAGSTPFTSSAYSNPDLGCLATVEAKYPLGVLTFVLAKAVYEYGLSNTDNTGNTVHNNSWIFLAGAGLDF